MEWHRLRGVGEGRERKSEGGEEGDSILLVW